MSAALTTRIPIRNRQGQVVDEKEVATYAGLLAKAHEEGLRSIVTELVQVPSPANDMTAVVRATVQTDKGTFTGIGDASPNNVNAKIAPHIIRMAETRAKGRALRDAVNIGVVCLEELGGDLVVDDPAPSNVRPMRPRRPPRSEDNSMTISQRRYIYRLASERGFEGDAATDELLHAASVENIGEVTKHMASRVIDTWKSEADSA